MTAPNAKATTITQSSALVVVVLVTALSLNAGRILVLSQWITISSRLTAAGNVRSSVEKRKAPTWVSVSNNSTKQPRMCLKWPNPPPRDQVVQELSRSHPPPTGLVVSLARTTKRSYIRTYLCNNVPSQRAHFIEPHGLDQLILLSGGMILREGVVKCLSLTEPNMTDGQNATQVWHNLDGTVLITREYRSASGKGRIFLSDYELPWSKYISANTSLLREPILPKFCQASPDYIQGTRFFTNEMLHLGILRDYDYWIKSDLDIIYRKTIPFHLLHDMRIRGALFAHTGDFPSGCPACAGGIAKAVASFVDSMHASGGIDATGKRRKAPPDWVNHSRWTEPCSAGLINFDRETDEYYTNFVIGSTHFFQSKPVLEFARFLNEFQPGFFKYRWTDQIFWHKALGLFLGPDFRSHVVDYTEFRCAPKVNCWLSYFDDLDFDSCKNDAYFMHSKSYDLGKRWNQTVSASPPARFDVPYTTKYVHEC